VILMGENRRADHFLMWIWERRYNSPAVWPASPVSETDEDLVREAVLELANQIIGNAVTTLNDQGFHFHVRPPILAHFRAGQQKQ